MQYDPTQIQSLKAALCSTTFLPSKSISPPLSATKKNIITTLFVENLTNIDFSYIDEKIGLSGQSWVVDLELQGDLNNQGMLLDFSDIKKSIKQDIEALWDHKLLVPKDLQSLHITSCGNNISKITWQNNQQHQYQHQGPNISFYQIDGTTLNKAKLEQHMQTILLQKWKSNQIQAIRIHFKEEHVNKNEKDAFFQYSHGLRLHQGPCQRIAHGHRSKIRVFTAFGINQSLSQQLADLIHHGYFLDLANIEQSTSEYITLSYNAPEGHYKLTLPRKQCIIMSTETTVENIAIYLLQFTRTHLSSQVQSIQVYEGWRKGSIATETSL